MAIQFRTNQIADAAITQVKHGDFIDHAVRVDYGNMKDDSLTAPPGSPTAGDQYIPATGSTGAWNGKDGYVVEFDGNNWVDLAASVATGARVRVSDTGAGGSFGTKDNEIMEYNGSTWDEMGIVNHDGTFLTVSYTGTGTTIWDKDTFVYDDNESAWRSVSQTLGVSSTDNALEVSGGEIGHRTVLGHGWTNPNGYNPGLVIGDVDAEPGTPVQNATVIANNGGTWTGSVSVSAGDYVARVADPDGDYWQVVGSMAGGDVLAVPPMGAALEGDFNGEDNQIAIRDSGNTAWSFVEPHVGDTYTAESPQSGSHHYQDVVFNYDGSAWKLISQLPEQILGNGLSWDSTYRKFSVDVASNGGIELSGSGWSSVLRVGPTLSGTDISGTNRVVDEAAFISGRHWKEPSQVLDMVDDSLTTPPTLTANDAGKAYVPATGSTGAWSGKDGYIVEWSGSAWVDVLAAGNFVDYDDDPTNATRVTVTSGTPGGTFAAGSNRRFRWETGAWTSYDANADGDTQFIIGEGSVYENNAYIWDGTPGSWILTATGVYTGGNGIDVTGNTISADVATDGAIIATGGTGAQLEVNLESSNPTLEIGSNELGVKYTNGLTTGASGLTVDNGNGIQVDANGVGVKASSTGGITASGGDGSEVEIVEGNGIYADASGAHHYMHGPVWETPSAGATHQFAAPASGTIVETTLRITRNGQLMKKVGSSPAIGEFTWVNGTRTMTVNANDQFDGSEEVSIICDLT